ncbi:MAG: sugar transferase, partial [Patescibacteria group bacterium]|nr:sugar transferase [Patescibacteria group bacterium]
SGQPIFYKHLRVGKNGQEFWLYKFRTMIQGADEYLYQNDKRLLKKFKQGDWKLENDPRITKFGRFLRNLTIDEFPQFFNVLKGEMSLIGPRAYIKQELVEQRKKYPQTKAWIKTILSIKPGITGPWQTSGRNEISFDKRAKIDLNYAQHYNLIGDLLIILKTPKAMLSKW